MVIKSRSFHGSVNITNGKLTGTTDTDYFYFFCPKCRNDGILRILDFHIISEGAVELYKGLRPKAKKEFTIGFVLHCPECKLRDYVKISNTGSQGGKLAVKSSL